MEHKIPYPWCVDVNECTEEQWKIIHGYKGGGPNHSRYGTYHYSGINSHCVNDCHSTVVEFGFSTKLYTPQEAIDLIQGSTIFEIGKWYRNSDTSFAKMLCKHYVVATDKAPN